MAVNFHISKDGNLVTIRHLKNSFDLAGTETDKFVHIPRYQEDFNTTTYHLTASNPTGSNIKIVGEDGRVIINSIAFTSLKTGSSNANIGASASATVTALNGTNFFGAGSIDDDISSNTSSHTNNNSTIQANLTKITALENSVKTTTGDRGVYITNAKDETSSKVKLTTTTAKIQAGSKTSIEVEETSPGTLTFQVAAGASGSEVATTAYSITGTTAGRTTHTFTGDTFQITSNSSVAGGRIILKEGTDNGTDSLTLAAPSAITASTILTFPDGAGTNGQVLSTNGSGTLSWVDNTGLSAIHAGASDILRLQSSQIGVSTNLSSTIAADRLVFYDHSATKLTALELGTNLSISGTTLNATGITSLAADTTPQLGGDLDVQATKITTSTTNGNIELDPNGTGLVQINGGTNSGAIKLMCEAGTHGVSIASPPHSAAATYDLVLPNSAGSANQVLQTDGSGNLSWTTVSGGGGSTSYVLASLSGRASMYWANRYYFGSTAYGWATDTGNSYGQTSKTTINDQYAHMGIVAPTAITNLALKATVRNDSSAEDIEVYVFKGSRPNGSENSISLTQLFYVSSGTDSDQDLHFNADASTSSAGISAGDLVFIAFRRVSSTNTTRYVNYSYTLHVS